MDISPRTLRDELTQMASIVESVLHKCLDDETPLETLVQLEKKVDQYHTKIDDSVFKFIALKQPAARDLRQALAIMKINTDLERMSDQAVVIKRYWNSFETPYKEVIRMSEEVNTMVRAALDSFVLHDTPLARKTIEDDQKINQINRDLAHKFINLLKEDAIPFEEGFAVIRVVKNLERIADLATNIAEDVIFLEVGEDVRHLGARASEKDSSSD